MVGNPKLFEIYPWLVEHIMENGVDQLNERTGHSVKVAVGPVSFQIDMSDRRLPVPGLRKTYPFVAAAEAAWQVLGTQDISFLQKQGIKMWDKFEEDIPGYDENGEHTKRGIPAAYGHRYRQHFNGRDQFKCAVKALAKNRSDRQIWLTAWDPAHDGLGMTDIKNVPCPVGFNLMVIDQTLHCQMVLRSSDVMVGLPYDIMCQILTVDILRTSLWAELNDEEVQLGMLGVTLCNAHIYDDHWEAAREALGLVKITQQFQGPLLPHWDLEAVELGPDRYVQTFRDNPDCKDQPDFVSPLDAIE